MSNNTTNKMFNYGTFNNSNFLSKSPISLTTFLAKTCNKPGGTNLVGIKFAFKNT